MAGSDLYTQEEVEWLKNNYANSEWDDIFEYVHGKTKTQIISKAHTLGVKRYEMNGSRFTEREDQMIREHYRDTPIDEFVRLYCPNRTEHSIVTRACKLKIGKRGGWTEEEDRVIRQNYYTMPMSELSKFIPDRAKSAIHCRINQLGLSGAPMYKYCEADIEFVRENYLCMSDEELGRCLHRAPQSIKELRRKNHIYRRDPSVITKYNSFDSYAHRHNEEWKKSSARKCEYKCFFTGEGFNHIHHLQGKNILIKRTMDELGITEDQDINKFSDEEKKKFLEGFYSVQSEYPLGICMKAEIHKQFHSIYGYGNNTIDQFKLFVQDFYPEKYCKFIEYVS